MILDTVSRLYKLDKSHFSPRDILVLYVIKNRPGINGVEIMQTLNLPTHSCVQSNLRRLIKKKLMEDHRSEARKATSASYHLTAEGEKLLDEIIG